jgi:hypothetical protein
MPETYKPLQPVSVVVGGVDVFLKDRESVDEFLQMAWRLLPGVLQYQAEGKQYTMPHLKLQVVDGQLKVKDLVNGLEHSWDVSKTPWAEQVLATLAEELAKILNSKPMPDKEPGWGFHKNPVDWGADSAGQASPQ